MFRNPILGLLGIAIILGSTTDFWLPISYRLDEAGASLKCGVSKTMIEWPNVKRLIDIPDGVKLTPLATDSRLEAFRGILLRFNGNRDEVKNAFLGPKVSASHLSYIGDGEVGTGSNIGAGTIFCNYDGFLKHRTIVGADVFVGSNSTLVAPVTIGDGAMIAAGSVITQTVSANAVAFGRARQEEKAEWARSWRIRKQAEKEAGSK